MNAREERIIEIMQELDCDYDAAEELFIDEILENYQVEDNDVAEMLFLLDSESEEGNISEFSEMPLLNAEIEELQDHVKRKITYLLGGINSKACKEKNIIKKAFVFVYDQMKIEFGLYDDSGKRVSISKLKRKELASVHEFVDWYELPRCLKVEMEQVNKT